MNTFEIRINCIHNSEASFVFSSSAAPLAGILHFHLIIISLKTIIPYGASKAAAECYVHAYSESFDLNTTILPNVYEGSLLKGSVVANMIKSLKEQTIWINGNGHQTRDFVYIDDLVDSIIYATKTKATKSPIHICSSTPTEIIDVARMIASSFKTIKRYH